MTDTFSGVGHRYLVDFGTWKGIVNLPAEDREGWDAAGSTRQLRYR